MQRSTFRSRSRKRLNKWYHRTTTNHWRIDRPIRWRLRRYSPARTFANQLLFWIWTHKCIGIWRSTSIFLESRSMFVIGRRSWPENWIISLTLKTSIVRKILRRTCKISRVPLFKETAKMRVLTSKLYGPLIDYIPVRLRHFLVEESLNWGLLRVPFVISSLDDWVLDTCVWLGCEPCMCNSVFFHRCTFNSPLQEIRLLNFLFLLVGLLCNQAYLILFFFPSLSLWQQSTSSEYWHWQSLDLSGQISIASLSRFFSGHHDTTNQSPTVDTPLWLFFLKLSSLLT